MPLTPEQEATVRELQQEIAALNLQADEKYAEYLRTGAEECYQQVLSLDSEVEMMMLVAYIPQVGEQKIGRVRGLVERIRNSELILPEDQEARVRTLDSINEWRATYNLPPLERLPRGVPEDASECTIAMAIRQSAMDLGVEEVEVEVTGGGENEITVSGYRDGEYWKSQPVLGDYANAVIGRFDEYMYLDLLTDHELDRHFEYKFDAFEDYGVDDLREALGPLHEEALRRGLTYSVMSFRGPVAIGREANYEEVLTDAEEVLGDAETE